MGTLRLSVLSAVVAAGAALSCVSEANALTLAFTFNGVDGVPGTVTGFVFGLDDNKDNQQATYAQVTSTPEGITDDILPFDTGFIDVEHGKVTNSGLMFFDGISQLLLNYEGLSAYDDFPLRRGTSVFGSPTYTVVSAVPLPGSALLFGAALLALGTIGCGMKRKKAAA